VKRLLLTALALSACSGGGAGEDFDDDLLAVDSQALAACEQLMPAACARLADCNAVADEETGEVFTGELCARVTAGLAEGCATVVQTTDPAKIDACLADLQAATCASVCADQDPPACAGVLPADAGSGVTCASP
jgi:hypothetical protein